MSMSSKRLTGSQSREPRTGLGISFSASRMAILLGLALAVVGCRREIPVASPRSVAKLFVQAMVTGDEQTIRSVSVGDEPSAQLLAAQARQNQAYEHLLMTATARF